MHIFKRIHREIKRSGKKVVRLGERTGREVKRSSKKVVRQVERSEKDIEKVFLKLAVVAVGGITGVVACKGTKLIVKHFADKEAFECSSIHENMSAYEIKAYINNWEANYNPDMYETVFYDFTDGGYTFSEADAMAYENA